MKPGRQVAPAVTARLLPMRMVCGARVTGSGTVTMIPVHVGAFPGPHVDLVVNLRAARMMHQYGISAAFTGRPPIAWSGMAVSVTSSMRGNLHIRTRLMPMLRAGRYTARVMVHDMGCGSMMHYPLAYETPLVHIVLR